MAKSFFDLRDDIFETLTEASALERRANREQKQADMAKVAAEQDRKRRRAREARQDYSRDRKRALEMGEGVKVGDTVHLGHATKGGTGVKGKIHKIDGKMVHIKNDKGDTFKGPMDRVSTTEAIKYDSAGDSTGTVTGKGKRDRSAKGQVKVSYKGSNTYGDEVKLPISARKMGRLIKTARKIGTSAYDSANLRNPRLTKDHVEHEVDEAAKPHMRMGVDFKYKAPSEEEKAAMKREKEKAAKMRSTPDTSAAGRAAQRMIDARKKTEESYDKLTPKQERDAERRLKPTRSTVAKVRLRASDDEVADKVKQHQSQKGGNPGNTKKRRLRDLRLKLEGKDHTYHVSNIDYETDGDHKAKKRLPKSMKVKVPHHVHKRGEDAVEDHINDHISDETGYLHNGYDLKKESVELGEAHSKDIVKGLTDMDGPFTVVAIKNNKVIKQENTKMRNMLPAIVKMMRKEVGRGVTIGIEDRKGTIRNTFKESVELDELKMPKRDASGRIKSDKVRAALQTGAKKAYQKGMKHDTSAHVKLMKAADTQQKAVASMDDKGMKKAAQGMKDAESHMDKSRRAFSRSRTRDTKAESVELDELSAKALKKYSVKSLRDREDAVRQGYDPSTGQLDPKSEKRRKKRLAGFSKAKKKMVAAAEDVEQVDELKSSTLRSYLDKARKQNQKRVTRMADQPDHMPADKGEMDKLRKRRKGSEAAASRLDARKRNLEPKLKREDIEQVDELKKETLKSYKDKAKQDKNLIARDNQSTRGPLVGKDRRDFRNRVKGIDGATRRLISKQHEDVEQVDELDTKTLKSYIHKASGQVRGDLYTGKHSPKTNKRAKGVAKAKTDLDMRKIAGKDYRKRMG